jgi:hypothetical protein
MLFIDKKQVTREELAFRFGIDLKKIEKRPEFEATKTFIDRINGGRKKSPAGHNILSKVMIQDPKTKMTVEIRYAETNNQRVVGDRVIDKFEPRQIVFTGSAMAFDKTNPVDLDKALYIALYPSNAFSPVRTERSGKAKHEFVDTSARAEKRIGEINSMGEAILHATQVNGEDMRIFAKGLNIAGVEYKEDREVRADLMEYAQKNPTVYIKAKDSQLTIIEGRIENFVDKGIFKLETIGSVRRWSWTSGPKEGEIITDIINTTQDAKQSLKNHIYNNINEFMPVLSNLTETLSSRIVAEKALQAASQTLETLNAPFQQTIGDELPEHLKNINVIEPINLGGLPTSFAEATDYLEKAVGKRTPALASKLMKGINTGEITEDNIVQAIREL